MAEGRPDPAGNAQEGADRPPGTRRVRLHRLIRAEGWTEEEILVGEAVIDALAAMDADAQAVTA